MASEREKLEKYISDAKLGPVSRRKLLKAFDADNPSPGHGAPNPNRTPVKML
ncbi:MAG: hypothetical protein JWN38_298 [Candidatus Saccharibacteria bacterium]|nr:hypothetical protein [Candidatus Saccharibacteria bacterium]